MKRKYGEDIEIIDSFITQDAPEGVNAAIWYLGKSLEFLSEADIAYFDLEGREELSRGCQIENLVAVSYGIKNIIID